MALINRLNKEIQMLERDPPHGIVAWPLPENIKKWHAQITGPEGTPYENGTWKLEIGISDRYPFEPPAVVFLTKIYHPNIDEGGRICLDVLKMPPKGSWKPAHNLSTVLTSIRLLLNDANPEDPLDIDIAKQFKENHPLYVNTAIEWTKLHAMDKENQIIRE